MIKKVWCKSFSLWWKKDNLLLRVQPKVLFPLCILHLFSTAQCSCTLLQWSQMTSHFYVLQCNAREFLLQVKHCNCISSYIEAHSSVLNPMCAPRCILNTLSECQCMGGVMLLDLLLFHISLSEQDSATCILAKWFRSRGCQGEGTPLPNIWLCPSALSSAVWPTQNWLDIGLSNG